MIAGAAYCRDCKATLKRRGGSFGRVFLPGTCNENAKVEGPESCIKPAPKIEDPETALYWQMFNLAGYGGLSYRGMDGDPAGHRMTEVRTAADALGIPWDSRAIRFFSLIEGIWKEGVNDRLEAREEARKRKTTPRSGRKHFGAN